MDGSSLPEPPQIGETGTYRSLLSRAVATTRADNAAAPAGSNPFARFAQPEAANTLPGGGYHPGVMQTQLPASAYGLPPTAGPISAAGVRPPGAHESFSALLSGQDDDVDDTEPTAKRRKRGGRVILDEEEDANGNAQQPVAAGYAPLGGSDAVLPVGGAAGPGEPSPLPLDPSPVPVAQYAPTNYNPANYNQVNYNPNHNQLNQLNQLNNYAHLQQQAATAAGAQSLNVALPGTGVLPYPAGTVPGANGVGAAGAMAAHQAAYMAAANDPQAHLRRAAPARLGGLQPPRPGLVVHAGAATPGGAFRSIGAGTHHPHPMPTALPHGTAPHMLAAYAAAGGATAAGGINAAAWAQMQGMAGAGGVAGYPAGMMPAGMVPAGMMAAGGMMQGGMMAGGGTYFLPQQMQQHLVAARRRVAGFDRGGDSGGATSDEDDDEGRPGQGSADRAEEVLQQVERISRSLRGALTDVAVKPHQLGPDGSASWGGAGGSGGGAAVGGFGGGAPLLGGESKLVVTASDLARAIGSEEVAARLKRYQLVGINYLLQLAAQQVGGAILADEMGLGKTAQTCVYLSCLKPLLNDPGPHLVVVPASLLENWQRELKLWAPSLKVVTYYGPAREHMRHRIKRNWERILRGKPPIPDGEEDDEEPAPQPVAQGDGEGDEEDEPEGGHGGSEAAEEEEEDEDGEDFGQPRMAQRQPGKGGGCGGLFDVFLTTYSLWERDGANYSIDRAFMMKWQWSHLVMDEAHALKNSHSSRSRKLRKVAKSAGTRVMLTGTPLQNDLLELHALLAFLLPHIFTAGEAADALAAQVAEAARPVPGAAGTGGGGLAKAAAQDRLVERMKALLQPFILRRLKSEVADQLVNKKHHLVMVEMLPEQRELYTATITSMRDEVSKEASQAAASGNPGRGRGRGRGRPRKGTVTAATAEAAAAAAAAAGSGPGGSQPAAIDVSKLSSSRVQHIFTQLRKVAQHPLLVRAKYSQKQLAQLADLSAQYGLFGGGPSVERILQELSTYSDHQIHCFAQAHPKLLASYILPTDAVLCSGKLRHLDGLLPKVKEAGSRVLLFSQWTTVLDLMEWYMGLRGYVYCRLDGSTNVEDRLAMVDAFNAPGSPYFVFLLSTRAGGQGLNLTGADTVILHDVDFNPQIDKQAEDRAHRLGQTRPVTVHRLVTKDTVDATIQAIAERKLALDAAVLGDVTVGGPETGGGGRGRGRGRGGVSAVEVKHMAEILSSLLSAPQASPEEQGQEAEQGAAGAGGSAPQGFGPQVW